MCWHGVGAIDVLHVTLSERPHHPSGCSGFVRGHQQMNMIGHQHEGMNATALPSRVILKPVQVEAIVVQPVEAGLTIVTALDQVQRDAG